MRGVYTVRGQTTVTAAQTLLQVKAGAAITVEVLRCWVTNGTVTADDTFEFQILRKSAAATVTSFTPVKHEAGDQAAASVGGTSATGVNASVEGTDTDIIIHEGGSILAGWTWLPTPEERIVVPPAGFIAIKSALALTSVSLIYGMTFREIG